MELTIRFSHLKTALSGLLLLPVILTADVVYHGQTAGDEAFRKEDYSSAASFYKEYQEAARRSGDAAAECSAMERRIDALILGKFPEDARKILQEYKQKFPGRDPIAVTIWNADILLMQNKYQEAAKNLERIMSALTVDNPRRVRALYSLARAYELSGNYSKAAELYFTIGKEQTKGFFGSTSKPTKLQIAAWERGIFCQAFTSKANKAFESLAKHPEYADPAAQERINLLNVFLAVKTGPSRNIPSVWEKYKVPDNPKNSDLSFSVYSAIGDAAGKAGHLNVAAEAYAAAYNCSPGKAEAFETLNRLILVMHAAGKKEDAAVLSLEIMKLFRGGYISVKFLEEVAGILLAAGKYTESAEFYTDLIENPAVSEKSKDNAMKCLTQISARITLPARSVKHLDSYFTGKKAGERLFLYAETLMQDKKFEKASENFLQAAKLYPELRRKSLYQAAYCQLSLNRYQQTLDILSQFFREPGDGKMYADAIYWKARALEGLERKTEAEKEYEKYSGLSNRTEVYTIDSLFRSGYLAFQTGDSKHAIELFDRLIKGYPKSAKALDAANWKVYIYRSLDDDYHADRATYDLAYAWPDSQITFNAMYQLAERNFSTDSYQKVMEIFDDLFRKAKSPENKSRVLIGQASLAVYHRKYINAQVLLDRLEKEFPDNLFKAKTAYLQGIILQSSGDFKKALESYTKVLSFAPDSFLRNAAYGSIGDCCFILAGKNQEGKTYTDALQFYQKILETSDLDSGLRAMTLYKLGRSAELSGNDDLAIEQYKKVLYLPSSFNTPASRLWVAKAAEAIYSIAEKRPVKQHIENAESALKMLEKYQIIPAGTAETRTNILKRARFRPRISK